MQLLGWSLPMGRVYQNYADAIFEAASHRLGRQVAAPRVLHAFDDEPESVPVASQPPPRRARHRGCQQKQLPASGRPHPQLTLADFGELQPLTNLFL